VRNDERVLLRVLTAYAEARGLELERGSLDWLFTLRASADQPPHHIFGYDVGLNSSTAFRLANDKAATAEALARADIPHVRHALFVHPDLFPYVSIDGNWLALAGLFESFGGDLVVKDNEGTGGKGVERARTRRELEAVVTRLFGRCRTIAVSPFLPITREVRFVVLDGEIQLIYGKDRPTVTGDGHRSVRALIEADIATRRLALTEEGWAGLDCGLTLVPALGEVVPLQWKHNLGMGAQPTVYAADDEGIAAAAQLAPRAMAALGARFGSVDIVQVAGEDLVLEVNAGVMLEHAVGWHPDGDALAHRIYGAALDAALAR